ncbi:MAG: epoxyqueuosine reductase QueH [Lachnospiraceae bacterium]|nr:epoxyqueuosine reductase QueH [Lachnospiraceae bacterium]
MANKRNYQKELDSVIEKLSAGHVQQESSGQECIQQDSGGQQAPTLLLHSCCAPCSSYCMAYLRQYFDITVFYYNPNITEDAEYRHRVEEEKRLIAAYNQQVDDLAAGKSVTGKPLVTANSKKIRIIEGDYEPERFVEIARGYEDCPEGGERCFRCFALRLRKTAELAKELKFDYFTTTLTISPLKNAEKLNEIGEQMAKEYGITWLPSDFKKKEGYKQSIELSHEYDLYRQDYCGCGYSKAERERQRLLQTDREEVKQKG